MLEEANLIQLQPPTPNLDFLPASSATLTSLPDPLPTGLSPQYMHKNEQKKDGREVQQDLQALHSIFDMPMHGMHDMQPRGQESEDGQERHEWKDTHHQWDDYLTDCHQMDQVSLADEHGG